LSDRLDVLKYIRRISGRLLQVTVRSMLRNRRVCKTQIYTYRRKTSNALSAMLAYCSQTVGWIKMPLDTEVGLGPAGDIVLDGDPAPPRKGAQQPPLFGPCLLWPNGGPSQQLLSSCFV